MPSKSRNDVIKEAHVLAGYTGSILDGERQRLMAVAPALTVATAARLTLNDLYKRAGERPRF